MKNAIKDTFPALYARLDAENLGADQWVLKAKDINTDIGHKLIIIVKKDDNDGQEQLLHIGIDETPDGEVIVPLKVLSTKSKNVFLDYTDSLREAIYKGGERK